MVHLVVCVSTTSSNRLSYLELLGIWYGYGFYKISNIWMEDAVLKKSKKEMQVFKYSILNRRLIRTAGGYLGLAASGAQKSDLVRCGRVPLVLHQNSKSDTSDWHFVGDTYIHGIMYRAAFDTSWCGNMSLS